MTTDACLYYMSIMDAKVVIHFDPPALDEKKVKGPFLYRPFFDFSLVVLGRYFKTETSS